MVLPSLTMTINDEAKQIRDELSKMRTDTRRRYGWELQRRILDWVDRAHASGMTDADCGRALKMKTSRFAMWRGFHGRARKECESLALVPIEVPHARVGCAATLITPTGYRVEGLALDEVIALLRGLA